MNAAYSWASCAAQSRAPGSAVPGTDQVEIWAKDAARAMRARPAGVRWAASRTARAAVVLRVSSSAEAGRTSFTASSPGASSVLNAKAASKDWLSIATGPATEAQYGSAPSIRSGRRSARPAAMAPPIEPPQARVVVGSPATSATLASVSAEARRVSSTAQPSP
ncbi:hypothetical protein [Thermocatellispora tengchongensis]|uniref:hypothetical protein n=1 Tax=Thermocatellispora tengchongensis TaxID=1073253 RepID=UPI003626E76F